MTELERLLQRARTLFTALPTYVTAAAAALTAFADNLGDAAGAEQAGGWAIAVAGWLVAAGAVVRSRTPVPKEERGLLPAEADHPDEQG